MSTSASLDGSTASIMIAASMRVTRIAGDDGEFAFAFSISSMSPARFFAPSGSVCRNAAVDCSCDCIRRYFAATVWARLLVSDFSTIVAIRSVRDMPTSAEHSAIRTPSMAIVMPTYLPMLFLPLSSP